MADARKTWAQLDVLFGDNTAGAISPQDLRDGFQSLQPHVAAAAPTVNDDDTAGFDVGHKWVDTSEPAIYECRDGSTGAAVWTKIWPVSAIVAWGDISGTLTDQADLQAALDGKATTAQGALADSAVQPGDDAADLGSAAATDGHVLTADGAGGVAWEALPAGGSGDVTGPAGSTAGNFPDFDDTTGKVLGDSGVGPSDFATAGQGALADSAVQPGDPVSVNAQTGTSYTLVLGDAGKLVTCENASAITLTIPANASVAFDVGTVIAVAQLGAGTLTIQGDTGVTVNGVSAGNEDLSAQYATASMTKLASDTWLVSGSLA